MKVTVDAELCTGCELCVSSAPEIFEMQGDKAVPKSSDVTDSLIDTCKDATQSCPVEAIKIEE